MSECRFQFDFAGSSTSLVEKIRVKMTEAGGRFEGSASYGTFSLPTPIGAFDGTYTIDKNTIWVEVLDKPFFVPCSAIESRLMELASNS